jgi:hypothetical protein
MFLIIWLIIGIVMLTPWPAQANPIGFNLFLYGAIESRNLIPMVILVSGTALLAEYLLTREWLARRKLSWQAASRLFLRVQIISFPVTQVLALFVGPLAEVFPLLYETIQYSRVLKTRKKSAILPVIILNLTSFLVGIILTFIIAEYKRIPYYPGFPF